MPSFAGPQKTDPLKETEMLYLLLADPVKRLDKEPGSFKESVRLQL